MEQNLKGDRQKGMVPKSWSKKLIVDRWLIDAQAKSGYKPGKFYLIFIVLHRYLHNLGMKKVKIMRFKENSICIHSFFCVILFLFFPSFFKKIFFFFFYFTILYWFCHTLTWIGHGCTCVLHPEPPPLKHLSIARYCTKSWDRKMSKKVTSVDSR